MSKTLTEIATTLRDANKKLQVIYAFNGSGKTRLSKEFKELIAPKEIETEPEEEPKPKVLYYNAFTEDLFYWDNDLENDTDRKLQIHPNKYTKWILIDQGQEPNIARHFQRYTNDKLTPTFNEEFSEIRFSFETGDNSIPIFNEDSQEIPSSTEEGTEAKPGNVKISKGEESCFIWSVFYSLLAQTVNILNVADEADRETDQFNDLQYVFIDDPVSSLDDTHLIELAVDIADLIKSSTSELKFIVTTHNPLFYNVLFNEFSREKGTRKWRLEKYIDSTFDLIDQPKDSPFSYHLTLLKELENVADSGEIQKYHFNFLRNVLEKTSTFLGYNNWEELLPEDGRQSYYKRIINLSSHSKHHGDEVSILEEDNKRMLGFLVKEVIIKIYHFHSTVVKVENQENATV
ncbi:AAA family ATPase [Phaeocystidibacter marisrubri]|uniref:AAA family ATPase n=1 Tax=Phaeocystidibacter marisrubri TaxID=1577780 RepID=A0A6L3ZDS3_9FLAO|nr:AAA family ATPase [Phaeocystidibacter marisrubri]KAB2815820.1 AAA family ATPase [Phaeocystidibacter marisrubri]GGH65865.1 anticodon nuclease [Phaeocystidibacter marisrubri]